MSKCEWCDNLLSELEIKDGLERGQLICDKCIDENLHHYSEDKDAEE